MRSRFTIAALAAIAVAASLLGAGCGGGVGSGGTGAADAGIAAGTVSGFGSVIVDGQRFDDRLVAAVQEVAPGVDEVAEVRLGDRVELEYDSGGLVSGLRIEAALIGAIDSVASPGQFNALGQAVRVNGDATKGPVTQFAGGLTGAADLLAGQPVEVHGLLVPNGAGWDLQATRIERLAAPPATLKVVGIVSGLNAGKFSIGGLDVILAGTAIVPAGRMLAEGQLVAVLAPAASLVPGGVLAPRVDAAQVRIKSSAAEGVEASVGGSVAALDAGASTFRLGTQTIHYDGARLSPATLVLANGQYVRARGRLRADGSLQATSVTLRDGRNEAEAELKGTVIGYDALTKRFQVRGVDVDASTAKIEGCPNGVLAEGLFVEIEGALGATGVLAKEVHCEDEPGGATVGRKGTAGSVDIGAASFVLTPGSGAPITVRWTATTLFSHTTPQTLAGRRVEVEGVLDAGVLVARKVEASD